MPDYVKKVAEAVLDAVSDYGFHPVIDIDAIIASVPKPEPVAYIPLTADLAKNLGLKRVFHETALLSEYIWVDQNGKEVLEIPVHIEPLHSGSVNTQLLEALIVSDELLRSLPASGGLYGLAVMEQNAAAIDAAEKELKGEVI